MELSSASSSSSSPEPVSKPHKQSKGKGKKKSIAQADHGKNEGVDPTWAYRPPSGFHILEDAASAGEFDWDAVADDEDTEIWLIRVPDSVRPKYLENVKIEVPPASKSVKTGSISRKHATFDIWSIGDDDQVIAGEEIKAISCLLPRKSKGGKLYPAPKPVARHIVVSAQAVTPTRDLSSESIPGPVKNPPRQCYPKEVLKHKFMPFGSVSGVDASNEEEHVELMDVDVSEVPIAIPPVSPNKAEQDSSSPTETKKTKGKKRKGDGETPSMKKTKKSKTS